MSDVQNLQHKMRGLMELGYQFNVTPEGFTVAHGARPVSAFHANTQSTEPDAKKSCRSALLVRHRRAAVSDAFTDLAARRAAAHKVTMVRRSAGKAVLTNRPLFGYHLSCSCGHKWRVNGDKKSATRSASDHVESGSLPDAMQREVFVPGVGPMTAQQAFEAERDRILAARTRP